MGIHSNAGVTAARAAEHAKEFKIGFPVLIDAGQRVADSFRAKRTAEVFVVDRQHIVRYHGDIDGRYGYTFKRGQPQRADLKKAAQRASGGQVRFGSGNDAAGLPDHARRRLKITRHGHVCERNLPHFAESLPGMSPRGGNGSVCARTFDEAVEHSAMMKEVIVQRRMPPWHADPRFGHFSNNRRMTQEEIDQLVAWIDAGTPLGDKRESRRRAPTPRAGKSAIPISSSSLPKEVKVPATGTVPYKYYSVPTHFEKDVWIQAGRSPAGKPGRRSPYHRFLSRSERLGFGRGFGRNARLRDRAGATPR